MTLLRNKWRCSMTDKTKETPSYSGTAPDTRIVVDPQTWSEIMYMTRASSTEISFMVNVYIKEDGMIYLKDVFLPKQENTGASTEMDAESLGEIPIIPEANLNCWVHSHVNMKAFWSGTDYSTIRQLGRHGYVISIVVNKAGEYKCSYYQKGDKFFPPIFVDDIKISVEHILTEADKGKMDKAMKEQCSSPKPPPRTALGNIVNKQSNWFDTRVHTLDDDWDYVEQFKKMQAKKDEDWDVKPMPKKMLKKFVKNTGMDEEELEDYFEDYQYLHHDTPTDHQFLEYLLGYETIGGKNVQ